MIRLLELLATGVDRAVCRWSGHCRRAMRVGAADGFPVYWCVRCGDVYVTR